MIFAVAAAIATAAPAPACPAVVTPDALVCRALEAQKSGDNQDAAQSFEEAAKASSEKDPKTARMWAAAGNLWIAAGQPGKAALDIDKALALPGLEGEQRGEALLDRARAAEAQNDLNTARARLNGSGDNETGYLNFLDEVVASGKTNAERLLDRYHGEWKGDLSRVYAEESF